MSGAVELIKEHYLVLILKGGGGEKGLAYALTHDFNFRDPASHTRFHLGQGVSGTVVALPSPKTGVLIHANDCSHGKMPATKCGFRA